MGTGLQDTKVTTYYISGIWMGPEGYPSHYAVHRFFNPGVSAAEKMAREEVAALLGAGKKCYTWEWSYAKRKFEAKRPVSVHIGSGGRYLCLDWHDQPTRHLSHLLNLDLLVGWADESMP
jgi:hypothetical protein